ncbi:MAG TPA: hypothetical protein VMY42_11920 [Thermoguttaceae bacterium]|nr:hypothetical protein [Thermoguttaceae bacterium]
MGKRHPLPRPTICVLDRSPDMRKILCALLCKIGESSGEYLCELTASPKVVSFARPETARHAFSSIARVRSSMEPCLLVTDHIGTIPHGRSVVGSVRRKFPMTKILLHSGGVPENDVLELQHKHRVIDDFVRKGGDRDLLRERAAHWYRSYWNQSTLQTMRQYIASCPDPKAKFFPGNGNKWLSIVDVYWEIVRDTELGRELRVAWDRLMAANMAAPA